jgi:hypothetical protein
MLYAGKAFAFFGSSESEYRGVKPLHETIAGFEVAEVTSSQVVLQHEDERLALPVGKCLQRQGDSPWQLTEQPTDLGDEFSSSEPADTEPAPGAEDSNTTAEGGDDASEILRRMMERRREEIDR